MPIWLTVVCVLVVFGVAYLIWQSVDLADERDRKKKVYEASLERLKRDPANHNLRDETLALGREYAHASKQFEKADGAIVFDETALLNDITAAVARRDRG